MPEKENRYPNLYKIPRKSELVQLGEAAPASFDEIEERYGYVAALLLGTDENSLVLDALEMGLEKLTCEHDKLKRLYSREHVDSTVAEIYVLAALSDIEPEGVRYEQETSEGKQPDAYLPSFDAYVEVRALNEWAPARERHRSNELIRSNIEQKIHASSELLNALSGVEISVDVSRAYRADLAEELASAVVAALERDVVQNTHVSLEQEELYADVFKNGARAAHASIRFVRLGDQQSPKVLVRGAVVTQITGMRGNERADQINRKSGAIAFEEQGTSLVDHLRTKIADKHKQLDPESNNVVVLVSFPHVKPHVTDWRLVLPQIWCGDSVLVVDRSGDERELDWEQLVDTGLHEGKLDYPKLTAVLGVTLSRAGYVQDFHFVQRSGSNLGGLTKLANDNTQMRQVVADKLLKLEELISEAQRLGLSRSAAERDRRGCLPHWISFVFEGK